MADPLLQTSLNHVHVQMRIYRGKIASMKLTEMSLEQLQKHIHDLEYQRDFLGCQKSDIDRLNEARTELVKWWQA